MLNWRIGDAVELDEFMRSLMIAGFWLNAKRGRTPMITAHLVSGLRIGA